MEQEHIPKHVKIIRIRGNQKESQRGSRTLEGSTKGAGSDDPAPGTRVSLTRSVSWTQNAAFSSQNKTQTNFLLFYLQTEINKRTKKINWFLSFFSQLPQEHSSECSKQPRKPPPNPGSGGIAAAFRRRPTTPKPRKSPSPPNQNTLTRSNQKST